MNSLIAWAQRTESPPSACCETYYTLTCLFHCTFTNNLIAFSYCYFLQLHVTAISHWDAFAKLNSSWHFVANETQTPDGLRVCGSQKCVYHVLENIYVKTACIVCRGGELTFGYTFGDSQRSIPVCLRANIHFTLLLTNYQTVWSALDLNLNMWTDKTEHREAESPDHVSCW